MEETKEVRKTISLEFDLARKLDLEAFWSRTSIKEILHKILENHYQGKEFDDFPATYKRPKTGRPRH